MNKALVGYTGFVGSNIYAAGDFSGYNTKNIKDSFGTKPDLLIYAGLRAEKFLANKEPEKDYELIAEAYDNIMKIGPKKLVLISTVDVIKDPDKADEDVVIETEGLQPYGLNRYLLEKQVREEFPDALIIRLPGLFGKNIKKNFIYDLINVIPGMLRADKFEEQAGEMTWAAEHSIGVAKGVSEDIIMDLRANFEGECCEVGMYLAMARVAHREGYPEIGLYWEKAAYEEAEHAAKFAELLGEVVTDSTKKNLELRVAAENGATAGKFDLAKRAKEQNLDAIHDTVHEMARDEARHGRGFEGLLKRYF